MLLAITPNTLTPSLAAHYNRLLEAGVEAVLLRLLGAPRYEYEQVIAAIAPQHRYKLLVDAHFDLVQQCGLGGVYLRAADRHLYHSGMATWRVSTSCHTLEELESLPFVPTFALLSPIYPPLSKKGVAASFSPEILRATLGRLSFPVLALGGITPERAKQVRALGFGGVASLGYLADTQEGLTRFQKFSRPAVLSVAGHDPTSGAGFVADALHIEALGGQPLTIATTLTQQNGRQFTGAQPLSLEANMEAIRLLGEEYCPTVAKIGLVADPTQLLALCHALKTIGVKYIIWDPILNPTTAPHWRKELGTPDLMAKLARYITLATPNKAERKAIFTARSYPFALLETGGDTDPEHPLLRSRLCLPSGEVHDFIQTRQKGSIHGSGCALTAAIATYLAKGFPLLSSIKLAGQYVAQLVAHHEQPRFPRVVDMAGEKALHLATPIQFITDSIKLPTILHQAEAALEGGIRWIQLRMKEADTEQRIEAALALKTLMSSYPDTTLIINDDVEAALHADADGVHLGLSDISPVEARSILGANKIIGATCNTEMHLWQRSLEGVDYIGIGPYRTTSTKRNLAPILGQEGMEAFSAANLRLPHPIPLVAIGGIVATDIPLLASLGIHRIAISGYITHHTHPIQAAQKLVHAAEEHFLLKNQSKWIP